MKRHPFTVFIVSLITFFCISGLWWTWIADPSVFATIWNPPIGIVQFPDEHAGYDLGFGGAESSSNSFQDSINWAVANKSKYNIQFAMFLGDRYQGNTNDTDFSYHLITNGGIQLSYLAVTNYDAQLRAAGITPINYPGNHDNDSAGSQLWWTNMFPASVVTNDKYFFSFGYSGDTHTPVYIANFGGFKLGFCGYEWVGPSTGQVSVAAVDAAYLPQTTWLCSNMDFYSDVHWVPCAHFFTDVYGMLGTSDDPVLYPYIGPGVTAWNDGFNNESHLMAMMCGHDRLYTPTSISHVFAHDGRAIPIFRFNTQSAGRWRNISINTITNGGSFFLHIVDPNRVTWTTYTVNADANQMVQNGTWATELGPTAITQSTNYFRWFP